MKSWLRGIAAYERDIKLFLAYSLFSNIGIGVFMLLLNLYLVELGYNESFIGAFQSANTLAMAVVSVSLGVLINRFGVWKVVTIGLVFFLITSALATVVTQRELLLVMAALSGAGTAFLFVPTMPFIVDLTNRRNRGNVAALAFSLNALAMTFGSLLGGFGSKAIAALVNVDMPSAAGYRATLIAGLLFATIGTVPLLMMSRSRRTSLPGDPRPASEPDDISSFGDRRLVRRNMMMFIAIGGVMSLGAGAVFPFYNVYLREELGASDRLIGLTYALGGITAAILGLFSPWVARHLGPQRAVTALRLAPMPFYLLLILTPGLPLAILAHVLRNTSINMSWPIDSTYASELLPPKARAQVFSLRSGAWNLGWSVSAAAAGWGIVRYGYNVSFIAYTFFMIVAMGMFYGYFRNAASPHQAPIVSAATPSLGTSTSTVD